MGNVYVWGEQLRILDWGDASVSHPFASLVGAFRFLEEVNGLRPGDPWFARLRDAYLEPWDTSSQRAFALALRVGAFAHTFGWLRAVRVLAAFSETALRQRLRDRPPPRARARSR
jgi:hypothetical protein